MTFARLLFCLLFAGSVALAAADSKQHQFFESRIRPVLVAKYYVCHSAKAKAIKGDFLLDTRAGIRKGGASGRDAVIPGISRAAN